MIQTAGVMVIHTQNTFRQIFWMAEGATDPQPTPSCSGGHWDGDDLVVEITENCGESWLTTPVTLKRTRFFLNVSVADFGHMRIQHDR